jgi:hypothetical protein
MNLFLKRLTVYKLELESQANKSNNIMSCPISILSSSGKREFKNRPFNQ